MASLTWDIAKKGDRRVALFLSKCKKGQAHELTDGSSVVFTGIKSGTQQREEPINRMILNRFKTIISGKGYKFVAKDGTEYGITSIFKSDDYKEEGKSSFNKGNVAEIIFAAAITARFKSKTLAVNSTDIKNIVMGLPNRNMGESSWKSPNKDRNIPKDDVCLKWGLSKNNWDAVKDPTLWSAWDDMVRASVSYANSIIVKEWADLFYTNNLYNEITVLADGETDQTGTKVDVRVLANDHEGNNVPVNINVSLKYGGVGQFGQYGGVDYKIQAKLWNEFFNIVLPFTESQFKSKIGSKLHDNDAANALYYSYEQVLPHITQSLKTDSGLRTFADAIKYHVTRNEDDVTLVALKAGDAINYTFDNFKERLGGINFEADISKSRASGEGEDLPIINIYTGPGRTADSHFMSIRVKRGEYAKDGTPYYRNIFEKKKAFTEHLSDKL